MIRDEIYMQSCKLLTGNKDKNSVKKLFNFVHLLSNLFPPSEEYIMPLLNFWQSKMQETKDEELLKKAE